MLTRWLRLRSGIPWSHVGVQWTGNGAEGVTSRLQSPSRCTGSFRLLPVISSSSPSEQGGFVAPTDKRPEVVLCPHHVQVTAEWGS